MNDLVLRAVLQLVWLAIAGFLLNLVFGVETGLAFFGLAAAALLVYHVSNMGRLARWLEQPTPGQVPRASGAWDQLFALLYRYERVKNHDHQELAKTLVRFRQAARAHPDGVVSLDADNRIDWCNDVAEHHFDLNVDSDRGQPIVNLLRQPEFVAYIEANDFSHPLELNAARINSIILSVQIVPYGDAQKLLLSRDITRLEKLEHMRRDFVANVSHEIRTPLTVIAGFVETMQSLALEPHEIQRYLDLMAGHSRRMKSLVEDLLILSRLEGSPLPGVDQSVGLQLLWDQAAQEARALSAVLRPMPAQQLDFNFSADLKDLSLVGVPSELQSAWSNLLSNAVRYTPAGGHVVAEARMDGGGGVCLSVQDSGPGIAPEHLPRLTERFYRVDNSRSRDLGGTGLGLSIVKHVMQRHGGELRVDSQLGLGSKFELVFPAARMRAIIDQAPSG